MSQNSDLLPVDRPTEPGAVSWMFMRPFIRPPTLRHQGSREMRLSQASRFGRDCGCQRCSRTRAEASGKPCTFPVWAEYSVGAADRSAELCRCHRWPANCAVRGNAVSRPVAAVVVASTDPRHASQRASTMPCHPSAVPQPPFAPFRPSASSPPAPCSPPYPHHLSPRTKVGTASSHGGPEQHIRRSLHRPVGFSRVCVRLRLKRPLR